MMLPAVDDRAEAFNSRAKLEGWTVEFDKSLSFERPELTALCNIWKEKAQLYGGVPPRHAFDARTVKPFITHITIAERISIYGNTWRYRFRLYSSDLARITGDKTGGYLDESTQPHFAIMWMEYYDTVLDRPRPLRFLNHYQMEAMNYLSGESFIAPMGNDAANPNMILACTYVRPRKYPSGT